jgi:outer membrane protein
VLAVLVVLSGCSTLENADEAADREKSIPGERTPRARELALDAVGPVTLDQIVEATLRANPSVVQARRNAEAARARVVEARGAYFPTVSTGPVAQYSYATQNVSAASLGAPGGASSSSASGSQGLELGSASGVPRGSGSLGLQASWLIYDFGHTPALVHNAVELALAAESDAVLAEVNATYDARAAFFNLEKEIELLAVARENVRQLAVRLEQVSGSVDVGTRVPYDLTKAQVDLGNGQLDELKAVAALDTAEATLAAAVGIAEVVSWTPVATVTLPPFTLGFDEAARLAEEHEPSLLGGRAREEAAEAALSAQVAALAPSLSLAGGISLGGETFPLTWNGNVGPSVNWTLFNGFANLAQIDEAAANLRAARASRTQAEVRVFRDARSAFVALENANKRLDLATLVVQQSTENLELAQGRFEVGRATSVDLEDAIASLASARAERVQARADRDTAIAQLWKSLGLSRWDGRAP